MIASSLSPLTGKRVFCLLLAFFGVVIAVNMVFLYVALSTYPGADTEDAYRRGVAYNDVLEKAAAQDTLGWRGTIDYDAATRSLRFFLIDADRRPIRRLSVSAHVRRTVKRGHDLSLALNGYPDGSYRAALDPPLPGQWQVRIEARDRSGPVFRAHKMIWSE